MASSIAISRMTWGLLGVVVLALIISVTSLVLVVLKSERISNLESHMDDMMQAVKERNGNEKRVRDLESQMMSSIKQREEFDKQWKEHVLSLKNLTDHSHTPPALVAFSVGSSKGFTSTDWARVPMEITIYNPTGYFRNDNAFHAPMRGVYSFHFSAMADWAKIADIHLYTQKLGEAKVHVARVDDFVANVGQGSSAGSVMVQMERDETASVWLFGHSDGSRSLFGVSGVHGPTTLFMGKLEYQLD